MKTIEIRPGSRVVITDAEGHQIETLALSGVESAGHSFPVIWVERPLRDGGKDSVPWPAEAVRPA